MFAEVIRFLLPYLAALLCGCYLGNTAFRHLGRWIIVELVSCIVWIFCLCGVIEGGPTSPIYTIASGLLIGNTVGVIGAHEDVKLGGVQLASKDFILPKNVVLADGTVLKKGSTIFTWGDAMALEREGKLPRGYRLPTSDELKLLCREPICIGTTWEFYKNTIKTGVYNSPMRYWGAESDKACCLSFSHGGAPSFSSIEDASGYFGRIRLVRK